MADYVFLDGRIRITTTRDRYLTEDSGQIESDLHDYGDTTTGEDEFQEQLQFNAAIDGMESLLLALACAGLLDSDSFVARIPVCEKLNHAIQTALDAIENKFS